MHSRRYTAFISYRHADNTQEGRRWAEWLHRGLERYVVPPDLIGTPNLRGEPIRDSLYPIFRDEDELPANADLATGIRAALEVSDHLIVLCSPRSAVSPWVRKEVREFKELGRSDRILAIIIAGEPNADDPAKAREGILRDEECFCEELRFGAVREDDTLDWTIRTEPTAADLRPVGTRAEGFVTAEAYREHLTLNSSLSPAKIATRTEAYRQQLDHALIKLIAGLLGVPLGQLKNRDAAYRTALAETEATKQREIAERERQLREVAERSVEEALGAMAEAEAANERTKAALADLTRQLERSELEEGRAWLERANAAVNKKDHLSAIMLAGRAIGFQGYGRTSQEARDFSKKFPLLLGKEFTDPSLDAKRRLEVEGVERIIDSIVPTHLPVWAVRTLETIEAIAFSPDGTRLAACSNENAIRLWDMTTGLALPMLVGHTKSVTCISFSPDGTSLASGSRDNTVRLWNIHNGKQLSVLTGHSWYLTSVAFSPDGSSLASAAEDNTVKIWNTNTGDAIGSLNGHTAKVIGLVYNRSGDSIATCSVDKTIKIWDTSTLNLRNSLTGHSGSVLSIAFSPRGDRLASCSSDQTVRFWDTYSGTYLFSLAGHVKDVTSIAYSPDGKRFASASLDGEIKLWDLVSAKEYSSISVIGEGLRTITFSPDGKRLASGTQNRNIAIWDAALKNPLASLTRKTNGVTCIATSPDGCYFAAGNLDGSLTLFDSVTTVPLMTVACKVDRLAFNPGGKYLVGNSVWHHELYVFDAAKGQQIPPDDLKLEAVTRWFDASERLLSPDQQSMVENPDGWPDLDENSRRLDLTAPLRSGLLRLRGREVQFLGATGSMQMCHVCQDTLAQLADPKLTPERRAELRMELCTKSSQFRAATALWQRLLQGEWPGFEGATVPKKQAPATIPTDSPIRRLYLLALIDATKHPQIHGHPTTCQTASQIVPVLTKEMMATPTISLAMMSLMQMLAKDETTAMKEPRAALMKKLEEVAAKDWLA